ncbi:MAG TPA: LLM class flavin-dependent oxidoreductase, partial [Xanthobacteraceae bacterium]|nr:LLM class flavin-dependent oxidoreductase [Xanthobacteraceae bacterium]
MEFGILFTSHSNVDTEPYPHRDVHARVTREVLRADELGFDYAWLAEHHFSSEYGIMPDVFVYAAYLAALTRRIKIGTAVVTLPLANPVRVAENAAFLDILSAGRFVLGLGSGYRKYEFDGFGVDFDARRDIQEEALPLLLELLHEKRTTHHGKHFRFDVDGAYELFPHPIQEPHPPLFLAGATERSIGVAGRMGFGLMLSSWTPFAELARQTAKYRADLEQTPATSRANPARGQVD